MFRPIFRSSSELEAPRPTTTSSEDDRKIGRNMLTRSDDVSRVMAGKKNFVSVKEDGQKVHKQKRLILCNLKETYKCFKDKYPLIKISFSKFAELRPKECILPGANGTHSVCVCTHHENVKLLIDGANIPLLTSNSSVVVNNYKDALSHILCNPPSIYCYLKQCSSCPGPDNIIKHIREQFDAESIEQITYKQWVTVDRTNLETLQSSTDEFLDKLSSKLISLLPHVFIAQQQRIIYHPKLTKMFLPMWCAVSYFTLIAASVQQQDFMVPCLQEIQLHVRLSNIVISWCPVSSQRENFDSPNPIGLRFDDFTEWSYDSKFTAILTKVFKTLDGTLVSVSCTNNNSYENIFHNSYNTYILIIHHRDTTNIVKDMRAQIAKLKEYSDWNPRAMFIVLLTEALTHQEEIAEALLSELWRLSYISNSIVLSPTVDAILKVDLNTADIRPRVNFYTFFPYSPPGNCGNTPKAFLINQWVVGKNGNGRFLGNAMLFPNKIPNDFLGCPIRVSGFVHPPFVGEIKNSSEGGDQLIYENGIGVRIIDVFTKHMNMSIRYMPPNAEMGGHPQENGSWTGVRGELIERKSDITVVGTWNLCHIAKNTECSVTYLMDEMKWFVPCARPYPLWLSIIRVFRYEVWIIIFVSLLLVSIFTCSLLKIRSITIRHNCEFSGYNTYGSCLFNMWGHILGASRASAPNCIPVRGFFLCWLWYCWFINTVYQTFLVGYFVDPGLLHQISSEEELISSDVELGIGAGNISSFPELGKLPHERRIYCEDLDVCVSRIVFEKDISVINSLVDMSYETLSAKTDKTKRFALQTILRNSSQVESSSQSRADAKGTENKMKQANLAAHFTYRKNRRYSPETLDLLHQRKQASALEPGDFGAYSGKERDRRKR
ncbi:hypothetical protein ANN_05510 [Periplaneta americana]|uniref:Uncharacterized protein n=1 Tax=Periplaneta americana TaxID=6978 RepID=A0ABQ8TD57_PERAM|nr:hypothetical protein ANN_05510 [Periplaneta americana]